MTAPIVWHVDRTPVTQRQMLTLGPEYGSTKSRGELRSEERPSSRYEQLWQRLAEYDVQLHGDPEPQKPVYGRPPAEAALHPDRAKDARAFIDHSLMEARREKTPS